MHSPVFTSDSGVYHSHNHSDRQEVVDVASQFVDDLLRQAQQEVQNRKMAQGAPQPASVELEDEDDITTISGLLKRGNRWHSRARQGARGLVTRLMTTLRLCK
ncbi:uncharacterized protein LOC129002628 [Macrosteles quadrilineatus]|uniref:uncharacterized protein LOC129002628 n=1 Tax=Macrosteles quadrilineatus TaxID=74068 RepID=UPI0023E34036|nr:uncharacterized protein LOC129002628 [Macrosteles quadrilineatus]